MRTSKDRTIEKKRRNKAMGAKRTEVSRARRVANKHKREEIHAIDPNLKVAIIDSKTFVDGNEIEIVDGKIKPVIINGIYELDDKTVKATPTDYNDAVVEYQEIIDPEKPYNAESDGGRAINDQIEKERLFGFKTLADRWRKKTKAGE